MAKTVQMMAPSFQCRRDAWLFLALTVFLALFPLIPRSSVDLLRVFSFNGTHGRNGLSILLDQALAEDGPIDVIFLGHSGTRDAVNASYLESKVGEILGRKTRIYNLAFPTESPLYSLLLLKPILEKRRVRYLVIHRNPYTFRFFSHPAMMQFDADYLDLYRDWHLLKNYPPSHVLQYYRVMVSNALRTLWIAVRPAGDPVTGALKGFDPAYRHKEGLPAEIPKFDPLPLQKTIRASEKAFTNDYASKDEKVFIGEFMKIIRAQGGRVAFIQTPDNLHMKEDPRVRIPGKRFPKIPLIGVDLDELFPGKDHWRAYFRKEPKLTNDGLPRHLTALGGLRYTDAIAPAIAMLLKRMK